VRSMSAALGSSAEVSAAAFRPRAAVALRLEGFRVSVEARARSLLAELGGLEGLAAPEASWLEDAESAQLWQAFGAVHALADSPVVWRLSVPPSAAARVIERLAPEDYLLDWGGGLIWIGARDADAGRVRGAIESGHATLVKAPAEVRAACSVFQPPPAPLAEALGRLKAAFDPDGRLNPGRMD
ncbi:MAG: 2-hydroxy-acid oxidase, partial [Steroidobacteraceae bacterium]